MSSLLRTYISKTIFGNEIKHIINLKYISSMEINKSCVKLNFATENDGIFGIFFAVTGGSTRSMLINCDTPEGAKQEVNKITHILDNYYKISDITTNDKSA